MTKKMQGFSKYFLFQNSTNFCPPVFAVSPPPTGLTKKYQEFWQKNNEIPSDNRVFWWYFLLIIGGELSPLCHTPFFRGGMTGFRGWLEGLRGHCALWRKEASGNLRKGKKKLKILLAGVDFMVFRPYGQPPRPRRQNTGRDRFGLCPREYYLRASATFSRSRTRTALR